MNISHLSQNIGYVSTHNFRNRNQKKKVFKLNSITKKAFAFLIDTPNRMSQELRKDLWW
ncbi:MAG TPA: hypothetical protein VK974_04600 [Methylophilaceae bacterium]|nr:hypothetical protein [Methylophilaceae bacterium]